MVILTIDINQIQSQQNWYAVVVFVPQLLLVVCQLMKCNMNS